ncbi:pyridoxal-phosphate dependent enzyme [Spirillospora sp. NPDC048911]|uniref:pyridoxal-phosphate dependent enzyme n=1 Tax=Spirillospora sp. NPDC048911 TaxID=3364527 RepID=UPI00371DF193
MTAQTFLIAPTRTTWLARPAARSWTSPAAPPDVADFHAGLPGYAPTPLVELPALAEELQVGRVFVKDESSRFGLPAFKILGASWAIHRALVDHHDLAGHDALVDHHGLVDHHALVDRHRLVDHHGLGRLSFDGLRERIADLPPVRLVTATDGNHGRAVARMAGLLGLDAEVFVPEGVHAAARAAIKAEGATVVEVAGPYDEAVREAAASADEPAALLIQDTAWPGYEQVPQWVVEGYATLFAEVDAQLDAAGAGPAGLVAVPVGVGSLAQAAVAHYRSRTGGPTLLSVEPETAASVLASLGLGNLTTIETGSTIMAGLNCATPSSLAWPYLEGGLDAAVAVTDAAASQAARDLAELGVPAGPCGAAALAGVRAALTHERRPELAPGHAGTIVLLSTEGSAANPAVAG